MPWRYLGILGNVGSSVFWSLTQDIWASDTLILTFLLLDTLKDKFTWKSWSDGRLFSLAFLNSKPVMDLLVNLCASYHLNPSDYTVEVLSPNKNNISFKPNSPIGSLEAERVVLKPRGVEEKIRRPYMPEVRKRKEKTKSTKYKGIY